MHQFMSNGNVEERKLRAPEISLLEWGEILRHDWSCCNAYWLVPLPVGRSIWQWGNACNAPSIFCPGSSKHKRQNQNMAQKLINISAAQKGLCWPCSWWRNWWNLCLLALGMVDQAGSCIWRTRRQTSYLCNDTQISFAWSIISVISYIIILCSWLLKAHINCLPLYAMVCFTTVSGIEYQNGFIRATTAWHYMAGLDSEEEVWILQSYRRSRRKLYMCLTLSFFSVFCGACLHEEVLSHWCLWSFDQVLVTLRVA